MEDNSKQFEIGDLVILKSGAFKNMLGVIVSVYSYTCVVFWYLTDTTGVKKEIFLKEWYDTLEKLA